MVKKKVEDEELEEPDYGDEEEDLDEYNKMVDKVVDTYSNSYRHRSKYYKNQPQRY